MTLALTIEPVCFAILMPIDVARLSLALNNLLLFAVRQSASGVIQVNAERHDDTLAISITDCAPAYSERMLNNLFDRHCDLVLGNKKDLPSSAFSLKIAAVIVARHGGNFAVSNADVGNRMVLTLPLNTPSVALI